MNKPLEYEKFSKDRRNLMLKGIDNLYDALDRKYLVLIGDLRSEKVSGYLSVKSSLLLQVRKWRIYIRSNKNCYILRSK